MFITPAFAQGAVTDYLSLQSPIWMMIMVVGIMYFLILRPQQQRVKRHQEMVKALRRGDSVVTNGGLVGKVTKVVDDEQIEFELSEGVRVRQLRSMISGVRTKGEPAKEKGDTKTEAKDDAAAK